MRSKTCILTALGLVIVMWVGLTSVRGSSDLKIGEIIIRGELQPHPKNRINVDETVSLSVEIDNPSGNKLEFNWIADAGTFQPTPANSPNVKYTAPNQGGIYSITLEVRSNGNLISNKKLDVNVVELKSIDVLKDFIPSGWMGDGTLGTKYLTWSITDENPHSEKTCVKVVYLPGGSDGWAGIYLQNKPNNWGDLPGNDLQGYKRLTFYARSNQKAVVEFKAGGISNPNKTHQDSFEASLGFITLTEKWEKYTIDLTGKDLSKVIGGFCWITNISSNPDGVIFYLDDIFYEE